MIIARAPMRVSLFGGGSDYPSYFKEHGGAVLGFAIKKYAYVSIRLLPPFFEHKHRIVWSKIELVNLISQIQHPAVRAILSEHWGDDRPGFEIHYDGDLPAMSGMGSSSSFVVAMLKALAHMPGLARLYPTHSALEAIRIEQDVMGENVGCQDQVWAAFGGYNCIEFYSDGSHVIHSLKGNREKELLPYLMLCFTGVSRIASEVAGEQIRSTEDHLDQIGEMVELVWEARRILSSETYSILQIGYLLQRSWTLKRQLSSRVSNPEIDALYETALEAGAIGGKLLGAGAGGFLLLFVEPHKQEQVKAMLPNRIWVDLEIDYEGAKVIVNGEAA